MTDNKELDALIQQAKKFLLDMGFVVRRMGDVSVGWSIDHAYSLELRILFEGDAPKHEQIP